MTKSRWANWSRGTEDKVGFGSFMEAMDTGNPTGTGTISPAERARQLGLQSDGSGGYVDPESGQVVARTVNNELVFYDNRGATGGVVSDGAGGQQLANAQPSWSDPKTGMLTTPPAQPESPEELAAVPDATPAVAPMGYNDFMKKKKEQAYANPEPEEQEQPAEMGGGIPQMSGMMGGDMGMGDAGGMMGEEVYSYDNESLRKRVTPEVKPQRTFADMRSQLNTPQPEVQPQTPEVKPEAPKPPETNKSVTPKVPDVDNDGDVDRDDVKQILEGLTGQLSQGRQTAGKRKIMERLNHEVAGPRIKKFIAKMFDEDKRQRETWNDISSFGDSEGAMKFMTEGMGLTPGKDGKLGVGESNREMRALGGAGMPGEGRGESRAIGFREIQALMDPTRKQMLIDAQEDETGEGAKNIHRTALKNDISWDLANEMYDSLDRSTQGKLDGWGKPEAAQGTFTPNGPVEFLKDADGNFTGETNIDAMARTDPEAYQSNFSTGNAGNRSRGVFNLMKHLAQGGTNEFSGLPGFFDFDTSTPDHIHGRSSGALPNNRAKDDPLNLAFDRRGLNQFKVSSQNEGERDSLKSLVNAAGKVKGSLGNVEFDGEEFENMMESPNFMKYLAYRLEQSDFDPAKIAARSGEGGLQSYPESIEDYMNINEESLKGLVGKNETKNPLGLNFRNMSMLSPRAQQRDLVTNTWGGAPGGGLEFNPLTGYRKALGASALFDPKMKEQLAEYEQEVSGKKWSDERKEKEIAKKRRDLVSSNIFDQQKAISSLYGMGRINNEEFIQQLQEFATGRLGFMQDSHPEQYQQLMDGLSSTLSDYKGKLDSSMPDGPYQFTDEELMPNLEQPYIRAAMTSNYGRGKMPAALIEAFDAIKSNEKYRPASEQFIKGLSLRRGVIQL